MNHCFMSILSLCLQLFQNSFKCSHTVFELGRCLAFVQVGKINKFTVDNVSTLKKRLKQLRERTAANKDSKDTEELLQAWPNPEQRLLPS